MDTGEVYDPFCFLSNGKRKVMRLFVTYEGDRASMEIPVGANVKTAKQFICRQFNIQQNNAIMGNETQIKTILVINYSGAELLDDWILSDLSISPGSTLKAYMKAELDPILYLNIVYNEEIVPIMEKIKLLELSTADLRTMASNKSGLPCGVFRMVSPNNKDMFDCHMVDDYDIKPGSVIRIETWDGWNEFLKLCTLGFTSSVFENISTEDEVLARFQMKVAMFIAAHFGHVDLAVCLCKHGIRPDEPVGLHPLRQWCSENQHVDNLKAPIHEATECGQISVLRSFVHQNITSIFAKDGHGLQPLNIALRRKMRDCSSFLLTKQWSRIQYNGNSIPLAIFHRLKLWCDKARDKLCMTSSVDKLSSKRKIIRTFPLVGQGIFIDGHSSDQISSRKTFPQKYQTRDQEMRLESRYESIYGIKPEYYYRSLDLSICRNAKNRRTNYSGNNSLNTSNRFASVSDLMSTDSDSQADFNSPELVKDKPVKFPKIPTNAHKAGNAKSPSPSIQNNKKSTNNNKTRGKNDKKVHSKSESNGNKTNYDIPLPLVSFEDTPRPYCYMGFDKENEVIRTLQDYYDKRGYMSREYAIKCLSLTSKLKEKPWLAQVRIAMKLSKESVKKSVLIDH